MAEQLAVDDVRGDRLAVERQQRPLGAKARGVDRAGDGFLAGAGLADDQQRQAVARRLGGDGKRRPEFGRGADQLLELERAARASRKRARARRRRGGGRHWRQALRAAARARPGGPGNRTRRRASPRPRSKRCRHAERTMTGRSGDARASAAISCGPCSASQLPRDRRLHFAAVRPLKQGERRLPVGGADDAPRRACGDGGDQSALVGIGVQQQERACRFFAHLAPLRARLGTSGKGGLKARASRGLGSAGRLVMDARNRSNTQRGQ